jgi:Ethanolamine utilization protein
MLYYEDKLRIINITSSDATIIACDLAVGTSDVEIGYVGRVNVALPVLGMSQK